MSRLLKFRCWDRDSFIEDGHFFIQKGEPYYHGEYEGYEPINGGIIQQFTGVFDKNKREIYEGDIIKYNKRGGICSDDETYVSCIGYDTEENPIPTLCFHNQSTPINSWNYLLYTFEVIGNILENPQLLTK